MKCHVDSSQFVYLYKFVTTRIWMNYDIKMGVPMDRKKKFRDEIGYTTISKGINASYSEFNIKMIHI